MVKSYVVSGANRGVGLGLIRSLLDESDSVVYAGVRDPSAQGELSKLASSHDGRVHIVKLAAGSKEDAAALNAKIKEEVGHLDVLIANAGISDYYGPLATSPIEQFHRHFDVNLIGPVVLYQELQSSLLAAAQPKFIAISTAGASIGTPFPLPATPYLASKAALNLVVQHIALEEPTFVAIAISPGWVQTDMGQAGAEANGMEEAPVKLKDSVDGILKLVHDSSKETHNGTFWDYTGEKIVW